MRSILPSTVMARVGDVAAGAGGEQSGQEAAAVGAASGAMGARRTNPPSPPAAPAAPAASMPFLRNSRRSISHVLPSGTDPRHEAKCNRHARDEGMDFQRPMEESA